MSTHLLSIQPHPPPSSSNTITEHPTSSCTLKDEGTSIHGDDAAYTWSRRTEYKETRIGDLAPGPGCFRIEGRIANFYEMTNSSKSEVAAKGSFRILIHDDTGAFAVRVES